MKSSKIAVAIILPQSFSIYITSHVIYTHNLDISKNIYNRQIGSVAPLLKNTVFIYVFCAPCIFMATSCHFAEVIEVITSSMLCPSELGEVPDQCLTGAVVELLDGKSRVVGSLRIEKHIS